MVYEMLAMDLHECLICFAEENNTKGVSEEVATVWLAQLITSVKHTQSRGIIHRDLKLENIFLDHNGNAIIGDFAVS